MRKSKRLSWLLAVIFVFTTMLGAVPSQAVAADLSDISNHWAKSQIESLVTRGVVTGYPDNTFKPDNTISRAEFITMTNRAFSFTATAEINYTDVPVSEWYAPEIAKAKAAGYIAGYEDGTMRPGAQISRQEVAKILSVILKLDSSGDSAVSRFSDAAIIPAWSRGYVAAMVKAGYITGYPDGTFKAGNAINRAEASVILGRALKIEEVQTVFDKAGTYGPTSGSQTVSGNVVVNADGVTLQNMTINGNLLVAQPVGEGSVYFKNVTVTGTTTIKGGGINSVTFDKCKVNIVIVNKPASPVRVIFLNGSQVSRLQLDSAATIAGEGIAQAVINANGVVIQSTPGSTTIAAGLSASVGGKTIYGTSGGGGSGGSGAPVAVTGITLNTSSLALKVGETAALIATIAPANATNKNVIWESDRPGAATVVNGLVTANGKGTATITAKSEENQTIKATCTVTVTVPVSGVSLSKSNLNMLAGGATATLVPVITPADAGDKEVTWDSADPTVATVDTNGVVTPVAEGRTVITVTTRDGGKIASCNVTVGSANVPVTGVSLNYSSYTLNAGNSDLVLVPLITPADATDTNVTWSTDAPGVATVNNGTVTAVNSGTANITATTVDGGKVTSCTITVVTPVSGIVLDKTEISGLAVGDADQTLTATINPTGADNQQVVWTTSDPAVATFIENSPGALTGKVRFIGPGNAMITATTVDGGYAAHCNVTVGVRVTAITLSPTTGTLKVGGSTLTLTPTASPASATDKSVTWSSSDDNKATVANGVVSPVAVGTVTITAIPNFKTAGATPGTATIDIFDVTKGTMIKDDTLLVGKTVVSIQFTIAGSALPLSSIGVTLNDGTVLQHHSDAAGTYVYTGSTNTALAGITSVDVSIRNAVSFSLTF